MQDIVEKVDRLKAIITANAAKEAEETGGDDDGAVLADIVTVVIDFIGEIVANSRRIAVALERANRIQEHGRPEVPA